ncbi:protease inhibitor [Paramuricea clavata]|uniref:Protease inhibitor n=1 Tax=Paramuricea clavata TaxID=317549 RepID=A0A6S7H927_PARCT|nr:protease inhibitor [Paramuricea clavata]
MANSRHLLWTVVVFVVLLCGVYYWGPSVSQAETHDANGTNPCFEPKFVGPCRAAMPRYYYNQQSKACEMFIFGGCSANGNNFVKKEDCEITCLGHPTPSQGP